MRIVGGGEALRSSRRAGAPIPVPHHRRPAAYDWTTNRPSGWVGTMARPGRVRSAGERNHTRYFPMAAAKSAELDSQMTGAKAKSDGAAVSLRAAVQVLTQPRAP